MRMLKHVVRGFAANSDKLDFFGYAMPLRTESSPVGALLTLLAMVSLLLVIVSACFDMRLGQEAQYLTSLEEVDFFGKCTNSGDHHNPECEKFAMPRVGLQVQYQYKVLLNESYFKVRFYQRSIYGRTKSNTKIKEEIGTEICYMSDSERSDATVALCPKERGSFGGSFASGDYRYVEAEIELCNELSGVPCANATELESFLNSYSTVSLGMSYKLRPFAEPRWEAPIYMNVEPEAWLGVEIYMRSCRADRHLRAYPAVTVDEFVQFDSTYARRAGAASKLPEIMSFYFREVRGEPV